MPAQTERGQNVERKKLATAFAEIVENIIDFGQQCAETELRNYRWGPSSMNDRSLGLRKCAYSKTVRGSTKLGGGNAMRKGQRKRRPIHVHYSIGSMLFRSVTASDNRAPNYGGVEKSTTENISLPGTRLLRSSFPFRIHIYLQS
jgi:hypothetical protein